MFHSQNLPVNQLAQEDERPHRSNKQDGARVFPREVAKQCESGPHRGTLDVGAGCGSAAEEPPKTEPRHQEPLRDEQRFHSHHPAMV